MEAPSGSPSIGLRRPIMHACMHIWCACAHAWMRILLCLLSLSMCAWHACVHTWRACALAWMGILLCLLSLSMHACMHGVHVRVPGRAHCCFCYSCPWHACIHACVNAFMRSASFGPTLDRSRPLLHACLHACLACMHACLDAHIIVSVFLIHARIDGVQARMRPTSFGRLPQHFLTLGARLTCCKRLPDVMSTTAVTHA